MEGGGKGPGQNELCTQRLGHGVPPRPTFPLLGWAWVLIEASCQVALKLLVAL